MFGFCITNILNTGCAKIRRKKIRRQKVKEHQSSVVINMIPGHFADLFVTRGHFTWYACCEVQNLAKSVPDKPYHATQLYAVLLHNTAVRNFRKISVQTYLPITFNFLHYVHKFVASYKTANVVLLLRMNSVTSSHCIVKTRKWCHLEEQIAFCSTFGPEWTSVGLFGGWTAVKGRGICGKILVASAVDGSFITKLNRIGCMKKQGRMCKSTQHWPEYKTT